MNDKYAILKENPKYCKRLFGINYENFKTILEKVQKYELDFLAKNPLSCRGIEGNFSLENQLLLALEYLRQYRSGEPSNFFKSWLFLWHF